MERKDSITREVRAILRSPSFLRSPSLSAILEYLLSRDLAGDGCPTQYDIGREALGKSEDFNETIDSSVRVQISRLRKALSDYYLTHQPMDGLYVFIRVGEYRLRTARLEVAYPDIAAAQSIRASSYEQGSTHSVELSSNSEPPRQQGAVELGRRVTLGRASKFTYNASFRIANTKATVRRVAPSIFANAFAQTKSSSFWRYPSTVILSVAGFLSLLLIFTSLPAIGESKSAPQVDNAPKSVPFVTLTVGTVGSFDHANGQNSLVDRVEGKARELLLKSMVSQLAPTGREQERSYTLTITLDPQLDDQYGVSLILADEANQIVAEHSVSDYLSEEQVVDTVEDEVVRIVSPAGDITKDIAKSLKDEPRSDFECFIAVESARLKGKNLNHLLDFCIERFPDGFHSPYLKVRKAFAALQAKSLAGETPHRAGPEWRLVSGILESHPDNSYANTLAAKILIARGECNSAATYARNAFSRGRTFPALELAVITDAYGCAGMEQLRPAWDSRIERIIGSNRNPHDLLEAYILIASVISARENRLDGTDIAFASKISLNSSDEFSLSLHAAASGEASTGDLIKIEQMLPAYMFNRNSRDLFMTRLKSLNSTQS